MQEDISTILGDWEYVPGELSVRKVDAGDGAHKIQVRMDLGLMQLEWAGRPDALRPHGFESLLDFYQDRRRQWDADHPAERFALSHDDCQALSQEAMKYYWRRISFFELKEYAEAERDALHNLAILDLCWHWAAEDQDRRLAEHHTPFVMAHRYQARAMEHLERRDYVATLREINVGIHRIEEYLRHLGHVDRIDDSPEIQFLKDWEEEIQQARPRTRREQLELDLRDAVADDRYEQAAHLRDRLEHLELEDESGAADGAGEAGPRL